MGSKTSDGAGPTPSHPHPLLQEPGICLGGVKRTLCSTPYLFNVTYEAGAPPPYPELDWIRKSVNRQPVSGRVSRTKRKNISHSHKRHVVAQRRCRQATVLCVLRHFCFDSWGVGGHLRTTVDHGSRVVCGGPVCNLGKTSPYTKHKTNTHTHTP